MSRVTTNITETSIEEALHTTDMLFSADVATQDYKQFTKVFLNGRLVGVHHEPKELYTYMKYCRLLRFTETPDYKYLRKLMYAILYKNNWLVPCIHWC